jgi:hypothetical protein
MAALYRLQWLSIPDWYEKTIGFGEIERNRDQAVVSDFKSYTDPRFQGTEEKRHFKKNFNPPKYRFANESCNNVN